MAICHEAFHKFAANIVRYKRHKFNAGNFALQQMNERKIEVICVTWNVEGAAFELETILNKIKSQRPADVIALAFQEIVLTEFLVDGHALFLLDSLKNRMQNLISGYKLAYFNISGAVALSLFFLVDSPYVLEVCDHFAVSHSKESRCKGKSSIAATILAGFSGLKRSISLIGSHFEPNDSGYETRNEEWAEIYTETEGKADYTVLMGDLNYRIELQRDQVMKLISNHQYNILLRYDQLRKAQRDYPKFACFKEAEIEFAPTYKFDIGTDVYDSSEKQRIPSYTDRVLIAACEGVRDPCVSEYASIMEHQSDHEPVFCRIEFPLE
jgi:hypothetical protein